MKSTKIVKIAFWLLVSGVTYFVTVIVLGH